VREWLNADEANLAYYNQLKKIWDESKHLASTTTVDANKAWKNFQGRIHPVPVRRVNLGWMRIAVSVIVIIGIGLLGYWLLNQPVEEITKIAQQDVLNDTLPDGSRVTMNKGSLISYPSKFKGGTRQVVLKGEAFFNVEPNKEKPFIVLARGVRIAVVGTSFNVKNINGNVEVVVETGIVTITKGGRTVELKANQKVTVPEKDSVMTEEKVSDQLYKYYRTKEFVCDGTPLWKLVEVLNEAYHSNIIIRNPAIRDLPLTTTFHNESLEQVLNVISMTLVINIVKEGDTIILQ
jgi:transmembrane sensor